MTTFAAGPQQTSAPLAGRDDHSPAVDVVVPVFNEERDLEASVRRLHAYLADGFPFSTRITVTDNASTDGTWAVAQALAAELPGVHAVRLEEKGRGRALRHVWSASDAAVVAYMDVDLSTDLNALLPLVAPLLSGHSDVAIGTRLARSARVLRGPKREVISRCYNLILHTALATRFSDAQCGFKAIRADAARALLPLVRDEAWFFDTELLVLAERAGLRIHEVPVDWTDDPDSRVDIVTTATEDLKGVVRLVRGLATGAIPLEPVRARLGRAAPGTVHRLGVQALRFAAIGVLSTLAYLALYVALRSGMPAQAANAVALLATAVGNTAANRRFTFSVRGRTRAVRHHMQGLLVFALALGVTSGSLALLHATDPTPSRGVEVAVLVGANLLATAVRFLLLRRWVFRPPAAAKATTSAAHSRAGDPAWVRPSVLTMLAGSALLYLWGLGASGWANSFYSAAVQAGTHSWKAFFFGSLDSGNSITVDKPPASLWVMELSARIFGVNSWSILVPEALMGVAAVGLLYLTVRRWFSPQAGLLAGAVLALTPVATLMFRFNNPDALLTLLLVGAAYAFVRALESTGTTWLVLAAALIGTGFITKMLQAFLVVPVFGLVYLVTADTPLRRRFLQLLAAGAALVVASGWWVAAVELTPSSARPYIGGSQTNSVLNLIFGYNGFGRITGNETGSVGGGPAGTAGRWGATGLTRMFGAEFGSQIAWLIPAALILLVVMLWLSRRARRTNLQRAQVLMWGGWLVVTGLVFSYAQGIIHPYYSVALAPAIAALVGIGAVALWRHRGSLVPRGSLAAAVGITTWWAWVLLDRSPTWHPGLRTAVVVAGGLTTAAILAAPYLSRRSAAVVATAAVVVGLAAPAAYSFDTAATAHGGAIPSAGPAVTGGGFGGPGGLRAGGPGGFGQAPGGFAPPGGVPAMPGGAPGGFTPQAGGRSGGMGGLLSAGTPSAALVAALSESAGSYTWVAATVGANNAAGYQLAADKPVMAIGGFNGSDPSPTLAQFQSLVRAGRIHYFIAGGGGPGGFNGPGGTGTGAQISAWVQQTFRSTTVDGVTLYDLTSG